MVMPIQVTATATAVRATALIGAIVDELLAELIGDGIAGIRTVHVTANNWTGVHIALTRLDNRTYGYCEETGEPISLMQLDARPVATLSVEAQERHERRERFYSDD